MPNEMDEEIPLYRTCNISHALVAMGYSDGDERLHATESRIKSLQDLNIRQVIELFHNMQQLGFANVTAKERWFNDKFYNPVDYSLLQVVAAIQDLCDGDPDVTRGLMNVLDRSMNSNDIAAARIALANIRKKGPKYHRSSGGPTC